MIPSNQKNMLALFVLSILNLSLIQFTKAQTTPENNTNCSPFCLKCIDTDTCLVCDQQNFYFVNDQGQCILIDNCTDIDSQQQCVKCLNPYYPSNGICQIGQDHSNCKIKSIDTQCEICNELYNITQGQCQLVQQGITNCQLYNSQNKCIQCTENFILTNKNTCIQKIESCTLHQNLTCKKCKDGFYLSQKIQFDFLQILKFGIYKTIYYENCLQLTQVDNCVQYDSNGQCEICEERHFLEGNNCVFLPPIKFNVTVIENCVRYLKKNLCYQCDFNYQLSLDRTQCLPIVQQPGCLSYSSFDFINNCNVCSLSYYKDQNNICQQRQSYPILNCQIYDDTMDQCKLCQTPYILQENKIQCISQNCKQIQDDQCQQCEDLYYLNQGICIQGTIEHCIVYETNQDVCIQCDYENRYILQNNQCILSGEETSNCIRYDQNLQCVECNSNALAINIQSGCVQQQRRLQAMLDCEGDLVANYNDTECVQVQFANCSNYDINQCYLCIDNYILYQGVCIERFTHYSQNCEVEYEQNQTYYLDFIVDTLVQGDETQYLQVHDENNYTLTDDLIALRYDDYLQTKPEWTELNKTLQNFQIKRKNFTNQKFVQNSQTCKYCTANSFPSFTLGFCANKKYVQKQTYHTEGCKSYYEENCIQCQQGYYLSFEYFLIDEFKIQLQENLTSFTEDNISFNGTKEKQNKYGYMYKTFCTMNCSNIATKGLISTPIYSKYLEFLNSGSFFRFNSNAKFSTSRAEIVLVNNLCLDEFDKQQDLDDGIDNNVKWEGCLHVSSSILATNHISKPYRSSITSNEQFSIFQQGKGLTKNAYNFCSKCADGYIKVYDLTYKDYKNSVVIDLDTTPTTSNNPFVKYTLGHHCVNESNDQIFELLDNCDMYTIESFPTFKDNTFHYNNQQQNSNNVFEKIYSQDYNNDLNEAFLFDYKTYNEMNRNFVEGTKFEKRFVCVKCKFGYRDRLENQKNFSIPFQDQCQSQQQLTQLTQVLQIYFDNTYGEIPYWLFEGFNTKEEYRQALLQFLCFTQPDFLACIQSPQTQQQADIQEQIIKNTYTIELIIQNFSNSSEILECSQCNDSHVLHTQPQDFNIKINNKNFIEIINFNEEIIIQKCFAKKRYFENCEEPIPFCDTSRQLEPGVDPKSHFFSCHYCLPQNGQEYAPIMNIKGMNLVLNVSKFQEEVFTNHNYKLDPEYSKRKGYEVLNQSYLYLQPLNDIIDPNQLNPDHYIACWPVQQLQVGETKTIEQSQQDQTIYIHQGSDIAQMNYRMFTFEKVQTNNPIKDLATNYLKEDQGQLYKGVYCKDSSFYYTFDFETLSQVDFQGIANGDVDVGKLMFNYLMQGILENSSISCTHNLTPQTIQRQCDNYKQDADGICLDSDLSFGIQVTQHYDQLRNRLRNFPLLFTDKELQEGFDQLGQSSKFNTYSPISQELFQSSSRNFSASIYLTGIDGGNLEVAYHQIPFLLGNGSNDFFNYGFFHIKNGIENCAIEGYLRESIDSYQSTEQFSLSNKDEQTNDQYDPFTGVNEVCLNKFSYQFDGQQRCYYYASNDNYNNFYDSYDLIKNNKNSIGCLRCKDGYELIDNNKTCQRITIPNCVNTNGLMKNSNSLVNYVIDNLYINSYYGIQEGIGCVECNDGYISLNDNQIQFYQSNITEQNSISNKIDYRTQQFTHKHQMCIQYENSINVIDQCIKYGIDFTKELKDLIYVCYECQGQLRPSTSKNNCLLYPDNCQAAELVNNITTCSECNEGYILNQQTNTCIDVIQDCDQHTFNSQNELVCQLCSNGQQNVPTCQLIENCLDFDQNNLCTQCDLQYQNFSTVCVLIPDNCQSVDINGVCQQCISSSYFLINNECIILPDNCLELNSNLQCQKCKPLYLLKQKSNNNNECVQVDLPLSLQNCTDYSQVINTNNFICNECIDNTFTLEPFVNDHLVCHLEPIEDCQEYVTLQSFEQEFQCSRCIDQKILQNGTCLLDRNIVQDCEVYQSDQDECQQCKEDYQLILKTGQTQKECIKVINVDNCLNYSEYNEFCQQCDVNYILNDDKDFCQDINCLNYNDKICTQCNTNNTYLLNGVCIDKIDNCQSYNEDKTCDQCTNGYYLNQQQTICTQSSVIQNCEEYSQTQDKCMLCESDYFLEDDEQNCTLVQEEQTYDFINNCELYGTQSQCKVCQTGYYLNDQFECNQTTIVIQNCQNYSADSQCFTCQGEYELLNNDCVIPDSNNCIEYLSSYYDIQKCNRCKQGYLLSFDGVCLLQSNYLNSNQEFQYSIYLEQNININDYVTNLTVYEQDILSSQNCRVFNVNQQCMECNEGYFLTLQNTCVLLDQDTNCDIVQEIELNCLSCSDGFIKDIDGNCIYNTESSGCLFTYENQCQMCDVGHYEYQCSLENYI